MCHDGRRSCNCDANNPRQIVAPSRYFDSNGQIASLSREPAETCSSIGTPSANCWMASVKVFADTERLQSPRRMETDSHSTCVRPTTGRLTHRLASFTVDLGTQDLNGRILSSEGGVRQYLEISTMPLFMRRVWHRTAYQTHHDATKSLWDRVLQAVPEQVSAPESPCLEDRRPPRHGTVDSPMQLQVVEFLVRGPFP